MIKAVYNPDKTRIYSQINIFTCHRTLWEPVTFFINALGGSVQVPQHYRFSIETTHHLHILTTKLKLT